MIVERNNKIYFVEKFFFLHLRSFSTARGVFHHVCSVHIKHSPDYVCLWNGCDRIKRQKWALISHVQVFLNYLSI